MSPEDGRSPDSRDVRSLAQARECGGGFVILLGNWGGQVYLTAPTQYVNCRLEDLQLLLTALDAMAWPGNDGEGTELRFAKLDSGSWIAGGLGGGYVLEGRLWLHRGLNDPDLAEMIFEVLEAPQRELGMPAAAYRPRCDGYYRARRSPRLALRFAPDGTFALDGCPAGRWDDERRPGILYLDCGGSEIDGMIIDATLNLFLSPDERELVAGREMVEFGFYADRPGAAIEAASVDAGERDAGALSAGKPAAYVILQGDWGGQIYVTAPLEAVRCDRRILEQLLVDLDHLAWPVNAGEGTEIRIEEHVGGTRLGAGIGGALILQDRTWVHEALVDFGLEHEIADVLSGQSPRLSEHPGAGCPRSDGIYRSSEVGLIRLRFASDGSWATEEGVNGRWESAGTGSLTLVASGSGIALQGIVSLGRLSLLLDPRRDGLTPGDEPIAFSFIPDHATG